MISSACKNSAKIADYKQESEVNLDRLIFKLIIVIFLASLVSCGTIMSGHYIQLQRSDNLEKLAKEFQVNKASILNANQDKKFRLGSWWFIPLKRGLFSAGGPVRYANINYSEEFLKSGKFLWPVPATTRISSNFGRRWGRAHTGIDIPAKYGEDIIAAENGVVSFSGSMSGYGKIIVVKHGGNFSSVYAHNNENLVEKGQRIYRGQLIAKIGHSGKATGDHLHFEIRKNDVAVNPIAFIRHSRNFMLAYRQK
ncbi:MAG: M23 family metallopeptidase [Bacteriovoracaceae bacterium]|jgi:murein DD-endopeptidase MepM/ murein hydrolase activator NlpD|nr:M23 family metallopeptidase [Bacteriovoracaceae bacterium]